MDRVIPPAAEVVAGANGKGKAARRQGLNYFRLMLEDFSRKLTGPLVPPWGVVPASLSQKSRLSPTWARL